MKYEGSALRVKVSLLWFLLSIDGKMEEWNESLNMVGENNKRDFLSDRKVKEALGKR